MSSPSSSATTRIRGSGTLTSSDTLVLLLVGVLAFGGYGVWLTGQLAALATHAIWPAVGIDQAFTLLAGWVRHAGDPREAWPEPARGMLPGPVGFYTVLLLVFAAEAVLLVVGVRWFRGDRPTRGMATTTDLNKTLSSATVLARGKRIRPGLTGKPELADVAVDLGTVGRRHLYAGLESSVLLIAPPRQGKTSQVIIPWLRAFPGAAIVTSVRTDVLQATAALRKGTAWLLDLDTNTVWPHKVRWTPIAGADDFDIAYRRADVMIRVGKQDTSDSSNAGFFAMTATNLLACWLHTAALTGRTMDDVLTWSLDAGNDTPIKLLRDATGAREGVVKLLDAFYRQPDSTRSNLWSTVQTGTSVLLGRIAAAVFSGPTSDSFDIELFLRSGCDTLYLVVDEKKADALAPLITAFVEEITTVAIGLAKQTPSLRLDPPLGLILDEVSNVVPLPDLPNTMSFNAGFGIFTVAVLQNLAAAERRWHRVGREELWKNSTVKIALGGLAGDDLDAFSQLAGTYRETLIIPQHHRDHVTMQASVVDRKTLSPDTIRTLDERRREALVIHATTPPVITRMKRHYEGPHAAEHTRAIAHAHMLMHPEPATGATP